MSCCGQRRASWSGLLPSRPAATRESGSPGTPAPMRMMFEYIGSGGSFTVESSRSGKRYRFEQTGARLEVDPRDRPLLAGLRQLRAVE